MRTADDELARGVHQQLVVGVEQGRGLRREFLHQARQDDVADVLLDLVHVHVGVVLGREHDGVDAHRGMGGVVVLHGELALGVRTEVGHQFRGVVADVGEDFQHAVRQVQRQRHEVFRVAAGVAEHHALVAGTLLFRGRAHHALTDVAALAVEEVHDLDARGIEEVFGLAVADAADHAADHTFHVDLRRGEDFAHHDHAAGGAERFTGHLGFGILCEVGVEDGVADLVGHLVGMTFGN